MNQRQSTEDGDIFAETKRDIRKRLRRGVCSQPCRGLCRMRNQAGATGKQGNDNGECRTGMSQDLDREQRAANRPNDSMNGVPGRIDPRNFVGEKLQKIKNSRDDNYGGITQDLERLVGGRKGDPMKMNGQAGYKNREIKIDPRQTSEAKRNAEKIEPLHVGSMSIT